ncbi:MAG: AmmeMemoRadiSam system radical SAM enzyme [Candidatus Hydrothermarchaeota archaeon]
MLKESPVREAMLYKKLGEKVLCNLCERRCKISSGETGYCKTRKNIEGRLYTTVYGKLSALESRPIEIKPFFHFWPGSTSLTYSTVSCNFDCPWCQNWHLSKTRPDKVHLRYFSPKDVVDLAFKRNDNGLCVSLNEPTLLHEFNLECFKLSKEIGLYNTYVSNGYFTLDALKMLKDSGLNAINIDIKGNDEVYKKYCKGVDVNIIWRNARRAKELNIHVEMINLLISNVNDDEECIRWIIDEHLKNLGPDTPIHFTRYFPAYKFENPPTSLDTLIHAYETAKKEGILFPYLGNVLGHKFENTYCPRCNSLLIKRYGYRVLEYNLIDKKCKCGEEIPIIGSYIKK